MRLIDADKTIKDVLMLDTHYATGEEDLHDSEMVELGAVLATIDDAPTVDAEQVVYCKDCAMSDVCLIESVLIRCGSDKPFCSIGEPKDGDKLCKQ